MEIALLPKNAIKIKGKKATFAFNTDEKLDGMNASIYFSSVASYVGEPVKIAGAGDYEVGGVKIAGIRSEDDIVYSMSVDDVSILIGKIKTLDKLQHKVKEHSLVVIWTDTASDPSFATSLATNAVLFYGENAADVIHKFAKENIQEMNKYSVTVDKLPGEMQTILLA